MIIGFPGNQFNGEIMPALVKLVEAGTIRVLDLLFVTKSAAGNVAGVELSNLDDDARGTFEPLVGAGGSVSLLSEEDIEDAGDVLEQNSSAALLLFEHAWAAEFRSALVDSGGVLIDWLRIPPEALDVAADLAT